MDYETWKKQAEALDEALHNASIAYRRFSEYKNPYGLLPDCIKASESYKEIDGNYWRVFNKVRDNNSIKGAKEFKHQRAIERRQGRSVNNAD